MAVVAQQARERERMLDARCGFVEEVADYVACHNASMKAYFHRGKRRNCS